MKIKNNSKDVKKGDIFICTHDEALDRHKFIDDAIDNGASLIVVDKNVKNKSVPTIKVDNTNDTMYQIYNDFYDSPIDKINLIGITGTDGKTTSAYICKMLLDERTNCGYMGTNGFIYNNEHIKLSNTTPEVKTIIENAKVLLNNDIENLVMEVSSEALFHNRCEGIFFDRVILTNVTGDHLNVHKTFDNYLKSKLRLFDKLKENGIAIINIDDSNNKLFMEKVSNYITYGTNKNADFCFMNVDEHENYTEFDLIHEKKSYHIVSPLLGIYNVYNLVSAIALLYSYNYKINDIINDVYNIKEIPGRMNIMYNEDFKVILDYAHTLNATKSILNYANKIKKNRIITVVGSAGGREHEKRKDLGVVLTSLSDFVIFTMDDPRYENVYEIIDEMTKLVDTDNYIVIKNRKKAIKTAIKEAEKDDIVLILGKGIDNYMAIKDKYKKYCDKDVILKVLKKID